MLGRGLGRGSGGRRRGGCGHVLGSCGEGRPGRTRPTNNQLLYKAYFRWSHYDINQLNPGTFEQLPTETDSCASVTSAFLQVLNVLYQLEHNRKQGSRNILAILSENTRKTKVLNLASSTHKIPDELKRNPLLDSAGGQYASNLDRNRYGNDDNYLFTVIKGDLELLDLCPCFIDVEIVDCKHNNAANIVSVNPNACRCVDAYVPPSLGQTCRQQKQNQQRGRHPIAGTGAKGVFFPPTTWEMAGGSAPNHDINNNNDNNMEDVQLDGCGRERGSHDTSKLRTLAQLASSISGSQNDDTNENDHHEKMFEGLGRGRGGGESLRSVVDRFNQQDINNNDELDRKVKVEPEVQQEQLKRNGTTDYMTVNSADFVGLSEIFRTELEGGGSDVEVSVDSAEGDGENRPVLQHDDEVDNHHNDNFNNYLEDDIEDFHEANEITHTHGRKIRRVPRQSSAVNLQPKSDQLLFKNVIEERNQLQEENRRLRQALTSNANLDTSENLARQQLELLSQIHRSDNNRLRQSDTQIALLKHNITELKSLLVPAYEFISYCQNTYPLPQNAALNAFLQQLGMALMNASNSPTPQQICDAATVLALRQQQQQLQQQQQQQQQQTQYYNNTDNVNIQVSQHMDGTDIGLRTEVPLFVNRDQNQLADNGNQLLNASTKLKKQQQQQQFQTKQQQQKQQQQEEEEQVVDIPPANDLIVTGVASIRTDDVDGLPGLSQINSLSDFGSFFGSNDKKDKKLNLAEEQAKHRSVRNNTSFSQVSPLDSANNNNNVNNGNKRKGGEGEGEVVQECNYPFSKKRCKQLEGECDNLMINQQSLRQAKEQNGGQQIGMEYAEDVQNAQNGYNCKSHIREMQKQEVGVSLVMQKIT